VDVARELLDQAKDHFYQSDGRRMR
jgi:hypothetical protein